MEVMETDCTDTVVPPCQQRSALVDPGMLLFFHSGAQTAPEVKKKILSKVLRILENWYSVTKKLVPQEVKVGTHMGAGCHLMTSLPDPSSWVTGTTGKASLQNIRKVEFKIQT